MKEVTNEGMVEEVSAKLDAECMRRADFFSIGWDQFHTWNFYGWTSHFSLLGGASSILRTFRAEPVKKPTCNTCHFGLQILFYKWSRLQCLTQYFGKYLDHERGSCTSSETCSQSKVCPTAPKHWGEAQGFLKIEAFCLCATSRGTWLIQDSRTNKKRKWAT